MSRTIQTVFLISKKIVPDISQYTPFTSKAREKRPGDEVGSKSLHLAYSLDAEQCFW